MPDDGAVLRAPHVRDARSVADLMRDVVLALLPCLLFGTWNVGRQALTAAASARFEGERDWRLALAERLGLASDPSNVLACALVGALFVGPLLLASALTSLGWEHLVARLRDRPVGEGAFVTALIFTLLLSPATPPWQAVLGVSFGMVFGKLLFGGIGRNFLNPAVTGLAYVAVAHAGVLGAGPLFPDVSGHRGSAAFALAAESGPAALPAAGFGSWASLLGVEPGRIGETSVLACLVGAAWLVHRRTASWRVMVAVLAGATVTAAAWKVLGAPGSSVPWTGHLVLGGLAFTAAFVATDPVSSASTPAGRWVYGVLIGALTVVLREASPDHPDGVVAAVLLACVAAPSIDHAVVRLAVRRAARRRRHVDA